MDNRPTDLMWDITNDDSQIIVGMDIMRNTVTENMEKQTRIIMKRNTYSEERALETYTTIKGPFKARVRLVVIQIVRSEGLLGDDRRTIKIRLLNIAKRIENTNHAHPEQNTRGFWETGRITTEVSDAINFGQKVVLTARYRVRRPHQQKISISHIIENFSTESQVDFAKFKFTRELAHCVPRSRCGEPLLRDRRITTGRQVRERVGYDVVLCTRCTWGIITGWKFQSLTDTERAGWKVIIDEADTITLENKCVIVERENGAMKRIF